MKNEYYLVPNENYFLEMQGANKIDKFDDVKSIHFQSANFSFKHYWLFIVLGQFFRQNKPAKYNQIFEKMFPARRWRYFDGQDSFKKMVVKMIKEMEKAEFTFRYYDKINTKLIDADCNDTGVVINNMAYYDYRGSTMQYLAIPVDAIKAGNDGEYPLASISAKIYLSVRLLLGDVLHKTILKSTIKKVTGYIPTDKWLNGFFERTVKRGEIKNYEITKTKIKWN